MAGFQLSINGRFWVSTEGSGLYCSKPADGRARIGQRGLAERDDWDAGQVEGWPYSGWALRNS